MAMLLPDQGSVLRGIHAGEVKQGYIWMSIVVQCIVQRWKLVVGAKVSCLTCVGQQSFLVDIISTQQSLCLYVVLYLDESLSQRLHLHLYFNSGFTLKE